MFNGRVYENLPLILTLQKKEWMCNMGLSSVFTETEATQGKRELYKSDWHY